MKKTAIAAALLCLAASTTVYAEDNVNPNDPCAVFLCMAGKVQGENPSECSGANKKFFSIIKKKKGSIRWGKTFDARKSFLMSCPQADRGFINKIMSKYGRVRG